ncbi:hypothetical protein QMO56_02310 [Roseomonas sp. E05]|uniref:hypothetical protein n=1 Tax=Roseomonas sp. E05 TaxID=3046310 RepID=UPI0024BA85A7|nr:hypothetical protein [Roseomonas sp. E05]MDJ0386934.1 hypothetical protein [Roseomonas sp. E05]
MSEIREAWPAANPRRCGCGGTCLRCASGRTPPDRAAIDRLARRSLSAALAHAQHGRFEGEAAAPEAGTPAGTLRFPAAHWGGWKGAMRLEEVLRLPRAGASTFTRAGARGTFAAPRLLYRVWKEHSREPLYIGMAFQSTIAERLADHLRDAIPKLAGATRAHVPHRGGHALDAAARRRVEAWRKGFSPAVFKASRSESERLRLLLVREEANGELGKVKVAWGVVTPAGGTQLDVKTLHIFELALWVQERPRSYRADQRAFEDAP